MLKILSLQLQWLLSLVSLMGKLMRSVIPKATLYELYYNDV